MSSRAALALLLGLLAACRNDPEPRPYAMSDQDLGGGDSLPGDARGTPGDGDLVVSSTCGNGRLDSLEACDGSRFLEGLSTCDDNWLGAGESVCTAACTLDFSGCEIPDYCEGNGFYNDDECDACVRMGGTMDPACTEHCGADDFCASWYDSAVSVWSCEGSGLGPDPDCGVCGNGVIDGQEFCDGAEFAYFAGEHLSTCEVWSYTGGTLGCQVNCTPDFVDCF